MDTRKLSGLILLMIGAAMFIAAPTNTPGAGAGAHALSALGIIPVILGFYRLATEGKKPPP